MVRISHRGNIDGKVEKTENHPDYIDQAIKLSYDVEVDVRTENELLYLGHDYPQYEVSLQWLLDRKANLWIHTKDSKSMYNLIEHGLRIFYHEKEDHTIINNSNTVWTHNLLEVSKKSIVPLLSLEDLQLYPNLKNQVYGVCSDYIKRITI